MKFIRTKYMELINLNLVENIVVRENSIDNEAELRAYTSDDYFTIWSWPLTDSEAENEKIIELLKAVEIEKLAKRLSGFEEWIDAWDLFDKHVEDFKHE